MNKMNRKHRRWSRTRFLNGTALGTLGFCTSGAVDPWGLHPEWVEVVRLDLPLPGLADSLVGKKIVQLSDLHYSCTVSARYLQRCIQRVNSLNPDLVLLTGDYVTYDFRGAFRRRVTELLTQIVSRHGVYACLGNHDYGFPVSHLDWRNDLADRFVRHLHTHGITVLRNQACPVSLGAERLWLAGLGDLSSHDFHPHRAFDCIPHDQPTIALVHNPERARELSDFPVDVVMAGHTHGNDVKVPLLAPGFFPANDRPWHAGLFDVGDTKLYVNRGLGRVGWVRFNCPPEITLFTLRQA